MKITVLTSVIAMAALGIGAGSAAASNCVDAGRLPAANGDAGTAAAVVCLVNERRAQAHLRPLKVNRTLTAVAARYSARMVAEGFYSHFDPRGLTIEDRAKAAGYVRGAWAWGLGENIAAGAGASATPETIVATWMSSRPHRMNMLEPGWTEIGVGAAIGNPYTSRGATYTAAFGDRVIKRKSHRRATKRR